MRPVSATPETTSLKAMSNTHSSSTFGSSTRIASLIQYQQESHFQRYDPYSTYSKQDHTFNSTARTERKTQRDEWVLPSTRKEYIRNHDATKLAELHASDRNIAPVWTKITKTPWTDKAKLCTGYGIAMERTKISADAPGYFLDPHQSRSSSSHHPQRESKSDHHPRFGKTSFTRTFSKGNKGNGPNESAHVLPGGKSILEANLRSQETFSRSNYRKFFHDKQAYIDHFVPPRTAPPPPIKWSQTDR